MRFQGQRQFSSCSHSSEINVFDADLNQILNGKLFLKKKKNLFMPRLLRGALCSFEEDILIHSLISFMPKQIK